MSVDDEPGGGLGPPSVPLESVDLQALLDAVRSRVDGVMDEQARMRLLVEAVVGVGSEEDLQAVLTRIVQTAARLLDAEYAALGVLGRGTDRLAAIIQHGMSLEQVGAIGRLPVGEGVLGHVVRQPEPVRLPDLADHPASIGLPPGHPPMRSFLGVQARTQSRVLGALYLAEKVGGASFTPEDERLAQALASAAAVAIENGQLYEEGRRREQWLEASAEITTQLVHLTREDDALQTIADRARDLAQADFSWLITGPDANHLRVVVVSGAYADPGRLRSLSLRRSLAHHVVLTGEPVVVEDLSAEPRAMDISTALGWPRLGATIVVPMRTQDGVTGAMALAWRPESRAEFQTVDPMLPARFAQQAALALQVTKSREDEQRLAVLEDRDRIGRDLHDLVIQRLFAVCLGLQSTARKADDPAVVERLEQTVDDLDATIKDVRRSIFALGVVEESSDVQSEIERIVERAHPILSSRPLLEFEGPVRTSIPDAMIPDLLAVLGQALSGVSRHDRSGAVRIRVAAGVELVLTVAAEAPDLVDDVTAGSMRERAERHGGSVQLESDAAGPDGDGESRLVWAVPLRPAAPGTGHPEGLAFGA